MSTLACFSFITLLVGLKCGTYGFKCGAWRRPNSLSTSLSMSLEQKGIVTIYKKEGCPHCAKAIDLLQNKYQLNLTFVDIESAERDEIIYQMTTFSGGRKTVPQIFFNSEHLGGNSDIQELETKGVLAKKVDEVRTTPVTFMQPQWYHPWY